MSQKPFYPIPYPSWIKGDLLVDTVNPHLPSPVT